MDWIYFAQNPGQCGDFVNIVRNAGNLERLLHGDSVTNPDFGSLQMHKYLWLLYGEDEVNMAVCYVHSETVIEHFITAYGLYIILVNPS